VQTPSRVGPWQSEPDKGGRVQALRSANVRPAGSRGRGHARGARAASQVRPWRPVPVDGTALKPPRSNRHLRPMGRAATIPVRSTRAASQVRQPPPELIDATASHPAQPISHVRACGVAT